MQGREHYSAAPAGYRRKKWSKEAKAKLPLNHGRVGHGILFRRSCRFQSSPRPSLTLQHEFRLHDGRSGGRG